LDRSVDTPAIPNPKEMELGIVHLVLENGIKIAIQVGFKWICLPVL
jgi:hypothetical protein